MTIKAILCVSFAANFLFCHDQSLYLYNLCFQPFAQEPDFWWTNLSEHQFVHTDGYKRMSPGSGLNKRLTVLWGGRWPSVYTACSQCSWGGTCYSLTFTTWILALFWMVFLLLLIMQQYDHWSDARGTFNIFRMVEEKELVKSHRYYILKFSWSVYTHHINLEDFQLIWLTYAKMAFL